MKKLEHILLVDDDEATNFLHNIIIEEIGIAKKVTICMNGKEALDFLKCEGDYAHVKEFPKPAIIFLDINMPIMDGWEFLSEYGQLPSNQKASIVVAMLTTSLNPDDRKKGEDNTDLIDFITKPLKKETVLGIIAENFDA